MWSMHRIFLFTSILCIAVNVAKSSWYNSSYEKGIQKEQNYLSVVKLAINFVSFNCDVFNSFRKWILQKAVTKENLSMMLYKSGAFYTFPMTTALYDITNSPLFNINARTLIYAHGFKAKPDADGMYIIGGKLSDIDGYNVLSFNTKSYTWGSDYLYISGLIPYLGIEMGDFISGLYLKGMPLNNIYVVGLSLGAQISSFAARRFTSIHGVLLPRITGLDPAAPCFSKNQNVGLKSTDAAYVDVIRTSILSYSNNIVGHSEYYVNGFSGVQTGCSKMDLFCSHARSINLYADTVRSPGGFISKKCSDPNTYNCPATVISLMGFGSDPSTRGIYTLNTNGNAPYAMGYAGI